MQLVDYIFAELVFKLGSTTKTNDKLEALVDYFLKADQKDKVWVIAIFSGRRPKRAVNTTQLADLLHRTNSIFHFGYLKNRIIL